MSGDPPTYRFIFIHFSRAVHGLKGPPPEAAVSSNALEVVIVEACHRARSFRTTDTCSYMALRMHVCMHARTGHIWGPRHVLTAHTERDTQAYVCVCVPSLSSQPDMQIWQPLTSCNLNYVQGSDRPST